MTDDSTNHILAALERLETGLTTLRADLMARMDRLQARLDNIDAHLTMGLGHADDALTQARAATDGSRIHGMISEIGRGFGQTQQQITRLERRIDALDAGLAGLRADLAANTERLIAAIAAGR